MITVTKHAKKELKRILSDNVDNWYASLRLVSNDQGGLGLGVDIRMPGDRVVVYEGSKVLLVEPELDSKLKGVTLDIEDTGNGRRLIIC
ncbi:hypothetical protein ACFLWI_08205, partial [Chloroflexota bacterium]